MRIKSGIAGVVLVGLMAGSQMALAETIYLQCGQTKFTVDLTNNMVDNHPASINPTAIDWSVLLNGDLAATSHDHIDRAAGTYTNYVTYHWPNGDRSSRPTTVPCTKGSAPDTKF